MSAEATLPLENFIQAVQSQLDKAQSAMAVKARNLNLPMTFAIKDINLDLRAHVEFARGEIRIRPATANEPDASVFHLVFTAITRPMIEENAVGFSEQIDEETIEDLDVELTEEERRKLEWVGVRTVKKLREMDNKGASREVGRVTNLPVSRLRKALERASTPMVAQIMPVDPSPHDPPDFKKFLQVRGRNLVHAGAMPKVTIGGRPAPMLKSSETELLLAPDSTQWAGELRVEAAPGQVAAMSFDLSSLAPAIEKAGSIADIPNGTYSHSQQSGSSPPPADSSPNSQEPQ